MRIFNIDILPAQARSLGVHFFFVKTIHSASIRQKKHGSNPRSQSVIDKTQSAIFSRKTTPTYRSARGRAVQQNHKNMVYLHPSDIPDYRQAGLKLRGIQYVC